MIESAKMQRNRHLMSRGDTAMLVVDAQEKLLDLITGGERIVWNIDRLASAAKLLGVPVLATEQYPEKLGPTAAAISGHIEDNITAKLSFSCGGCVDCVLQLRSLDIDKVLVVGIETHVCIMQTCFDLMTAGYEVYVAADAIGARFKIDHDMALRRMEVNGVVLSTTETAIFEWCEVAGGPNFKSITEIIRRPVPGDL